MIKIIFLILSIKVYALKAYYVSSPFYDLKKRLQEKPTSGYYLEIDKSDKREVLKLFNNGKFLSKKEKIKNRDGKIINFFNAKNILINKTLIKDEKIIEENLYNTVGKFIATITFYYSGSNLDYKEVKDKIGNKKLIYYIKDPNTNELISTYDNFSNSILLSYNSNYGISSSVININNNIKKLSLYGKNSSLFKNILFHERGFDVETFEYLNAKDYIKTLTSYNEEDKLISTYENKTLSSEEFYKNNKKIKELKYEYISANNLLSKLTTINWEKDKREETLIEFKYSNEEILESEREFFNGKLKKETIYYSLNHYLRKIYNEREEFILEIEYKDGKKINENVIQDFIKR